MASLQLFKYINCSFEEERRVWCRGSPSQRIGGALFQLYNRKNEKKKEEEEAISI